ncbi:hypothetical protein [Mycobacterium lepromatosis]|uniref:HoxN/HupN/NixA family nickel/cobalt transporter n=1 Tax=Mycobacterium lepromatosis TaxID=480418 RepID=UPI00067896A6|nr:hypothetical protein [Mycobacterium lepromatosis]
MTAYTLGLRYTFDTDHITAIDNTTRTLVNDGKHPLGVGSVSLEHATVVFGLAVPLATGMQTIVGPVKDNSSALHHRTALIGTNAPKTFLTASRC